MIRRLAALLCLAACAAGAEGTQSDGIAVAQRLSDQDLYRLATCGAPPGGDCVTSALRWPKARLTVRIATGNDPLPRGFEPRLVRAASRAITQINRAGAGITLSLTQADRADITIRPTDLPEGTVLTNIPGFSGRGILGVGYMTVWTDGSDAITHAVILISTAITDSDLTSVMLEEVTQSLGFLYDIDGPAYEGVSILSQTSNATVTIAGQDAALLRLHYPPP
jgi:Protein of unknown function (DUF2927)